MARAKGDIVPRSALGSGEQDAAGLKLDNNARGATGAVRAGAIGGTSKCSLLSRDPRDPSCPRRLAGGPSAEFFGASGLHSLGTFVPVTDIKVC